MGVNNALQSIAEKEKIKTSNFMNYLCVCKKERFRCMGGALGHFATWPA